MIKFPSITCCTFKWHYPLSCSIPLLDKPLPLSLEWHIKRLQQRGCGAVKAVAEGEANSKFVAGGQIQLCSQRDIPITRKRELPVHLEVVHQIGPAIAATDITARTLQKRQRSAERQPGCTFLSREYLLSGHLSGETIIVPATNFEMRCKQDVEF